MNNKGQNLILSIAMAVMIFSAGMLFLNHVKDDVSLTRSVLALDCSNTAISDGTKLTCLGVDLVIPILMITIISIAGGTIMSRLLL